MRGVYEKVPGSGVWWIRFAASTGRIRREKAGTKSAAKQLYQIRKATVLQKQKLPHTLRARAVTFAELAQSALAYGVVHKLSFYSDNIRMKRLVEWFGNSTAESLRPQDIEKRLLAEAAENEWKPATVNRYMALISLVYRLAVENGKVPSNPVRLVRRLKENNAVIRFLTTQEEDRLRKVVEPLHPKRWAAIQFALNTGIRAGEQLNLTVEDLEIGESPQLRLPTTKNGSIRYVPLNGYALAALSTVGTSNPKARAFDLGRYRDWLSEALTGANIEKFTWHCFRHTFASRLVMAGVDIRTVAELMGHKTLQMTMRYAHMAPEHKAAAVDKLVMKATGTKTDTAPEEVVHAAA